jgi:predicted NUDIX family NTP pyrophosphohydrolase
VRVSSCIAAGRDSSSSSSRIPAGRSRPARTIPKGEPRRGEDLLAVAQREFQEETGLTPRGPFIPLGSIQQKGGKWVHAWGFEGDCTGPITSNTFRTEWPPDSGQYTEFPEVDRAEFFPLAEARKRLKTRQVPLIERLAAHLESAHC